MVIDKKLLSKWQLLRSPEDAKKLVEQMPGSYAELFQRAFRVGKCNDEVFKVMANYYSQKAELVKEYL